MSQGPLTVLMFHRLGDGRIPGRETGEETYAVSLDRFETHLEALGDSGVRVVDPAELSGPGVGWPVNRRPAVCLTFDDGNLTDHAVALPRLQKRGWGGLFFVVPAWVGTPGYLGWSEIRELRREGMEIGAHGFDHTYLGGLDDAQVRWQLREARQLLGAELGAPPATLSLPGGSGGGRAVRIALEVGFTLVATSEPRLARPGLRAPLPRFAVRRGDSPATVRALAEQRPGAIWRWRGRHLLLQTLRGALGEGGYQRLRGVWAGDGGPREETA
jgi:peptidoglycan/xylan/chitin deacetylase (PgdA/CDA1 family)